LCKVGAGKFYTKGQHKTELYRHGAMFRLAGGVEFVPFGSGKTGKI
jgi:hypothetical protein